MSYEVYLDRVAREGFSKKRIFKIDPLDLPMALESFFSWSYF